MTIWFSQLTGMHPSDAMIQVLTRKLVVRGLRTMVAAFVLQR